MYIPEDEHWAATSEALLGDCEGCPQWGHQKLITGAGGSTHVLGLRHFCSQTKDAVSVFQTQPLKIEAASFYNFFSCLILVTLYLKNEAIIEYVSCGRDSRVICLYPEI